MSLKFIAFRIGLILSFTFLAATAHAQRPLGIDVYENTGIITWSTVKSDGISFAWAKATEGTYYEDTNFVYNQVNGKAAGVYMGAYHFCRPDLDAPATEATFFWNFAKNYVKNDGKTLMPMLDFETFNGYVGASSYADWVNQWCYDVQTNAAAVGVNVTPVVYCSACSGACDLDSSDSGWGAWIANYNGQAAQTGTPWSECTSCEAWGPGVWDFWQYSSSGMIAGVPGTYTSGLCDEDVYNGTSNELVLSSVAGSIAVTSAPTNTTVALGGAVNFNVTASTSGNALAYQWRFNQVNIPNATTSDYSITNVQLTNAGAYTVYVTNNNGNVLTSPAFLSVLGPLVNAPNSAIDPSNMVNWWTADGNPFDIYGVTNATPLGGLSYTNGEVGLAFRFDGTSAYLTTSGGELAVPWTACMWVYRQNAPAGSDALTGDGTYSLKLEQWDDTREAGISYSGVGDYLFQPGYTVPQNTWTHLAFVATSSSVSLYANGVLKGSTNVSSFPLPRAYIGVNTFSGSSSDYLMGAVDEIQIFNHALSASQIASIYNAGSAGLVRAPQFTSATNLNNGQIRLNLIGQTGKTITLLSTPNLSSGWSTLGTVSNPTGATNYTDSTTSSPQKFYQAMQKY